jgi:hypothetical protein
MNIEHYTVIILIGDSPQCSETKIHENVINYELRVPIIIRIIITVNLY